jgi:predicted dehydrogenase
VNDPEQGGGRLLGEVCHLIDFLSFLAGTPAIEVQTQDVPTLQPQSGENLIISLKYANGSHGTISYLSNGDRAYSKERIEVFSGGCAAVLDDFRRLELVRRGRKRIFRSRFHQDKGHRAELAAFLSAIRNGGQAPIAFENIVNTTLATLRAAESRACGRPVIVDATGFIASRSNVGRSA